MLCALGAMLVSALGGAAVAAEAPYALVVARASGPAGERVPVTLEVDFRDVAAALDLADWQLREVPVAVLEAEGGRLDPVPVQLDPSPETPGAGRLTLLLVPADLPQRVRLYFTPQVPDVPPPDTPAIEVQTADGTVTVANGHVRITHDPARMGGLPSRIEFLPTGKVCDTFALNDRVYQKDLGGFRLADDRQSQVELLGRGPLCAQVRVRARYLQGDKAPASAPTADYRFTYYAGSPLVRIEALMEQQEPCSWSELHLWEFNFPDQSFTRWLSGDPEASGNLVADSGSHSGGLFMGASDGANVLAVVGSHGTLHDGRGGYGTYVHGPWVGWSGLEQKLSVTVWIGAAAQDAPAILRSAAGSVARAQFACVSVPRLEQRLADLERAAARRPAPQRARWRWLATLVRRQAEKAGGLRGAVTAAEKLTGLAQKGAAPSAGQAVLDPALTVFGNDEVGWAFERDARTARPISCFDLGAERELLSASPTPLWDILLQRPDGTTVRATADDCTAAEVSGGALAAQLTWTLPDDLGGAEARAEVKLDGPAASWQIEVTGLRSGWSVREVAFPQLAVGPLGESAEDDALLLPQGAGTLKRAPLRQPVEFSGMYPDGWCSFQLMSYHDPDGGLYFACEDPRASTKQIISRRTADSRGQVLTYNWYVPDMGVPDNTFRSPAPTVARPFRGDWFDAAQLYRAWAENSADWWPRETRWSRPDTPQWMREVCVWACTGGASGECVQKVKDFAAFMGVPTAFHWYSWHQIPFDVEYPHYFPTRPGMAEGVRELQAAGVRVMPYINGRLWDTALQDFKDSAIAAATKDADGKPYIEEYGSGAKLAPMCPTQRLWQEKVQEIVLRLVTEVGVDGVYIDQIGAAAPRLCMDKSHGHPLGGGHWWTQGGYWPLLSELQAKLPPDKMITTECNAESYARWFDAYLTWHWQQQDMVPAFPAIYAGRVQLFSRAYNGGDQQAHWMRIGQQLVFGEQLGWVDPANILPHADTADFMRRAARARYDNLAYLAEGRMARPPKVEGQIPDVTADWAWSGKWIVTDSALQKGAWFAEDGSLLLVFANVSGEALSAELAFDAADYGWPAKAKLALGDGEARPAQFREPLSLGPREIRVLKLRRTP